jgi:CHAT domain-containing protein
MKTRAVIDPRLGTAVLTAVLFIGGAQPAQPPAPQPAAAKQHFREALALQQRLLLREAELLSEADGLSLAASFPNTRDAFLSVTRDMPGDPADYDLLWQGRAIVTHELERRQRDLRASRYSATRVLADRLHSTRRRLANLLLNPDQDAARHAAEVQALTATKEELERELAARLRQGQPPANPPAPGDLAKALPADAAFLDFYRYTQITGQRRTPHYAAFLLVNGRPAERIELGAANPLEKAWATWRRAIRDRAPAARERPAAAALGQLLWEPIRQKLPAGVKTLYLAPDMALTQVPFAALPGKQAGTVLLEEYAFATVPHGPFLLERLAGKGQARPKGGLVLAVGGVDYAEPPRLDPAAVTVLGTAAVEARRVVWRPLPGTRREVEQVAALARKQAGLEVKALTGAAATTTAVLAEMPKARYAHLATHGFFVEPRAGPKASRSPLALSGLVFAGANRGPDADPDHGLVTAEAIVGLRLDGLELAVLAASDTALGAAGGGEGVYGLTRAFHLAGCRDVIASLWAVDDDATAALMALFYRNLWERKLDPLQALRQAQLELYRRPQRAKEIVTRDADWTPRPLPDAGAAAPRAPTARWAAFTFSGVADWVTRRSGS